MPTKQNTNVIAAVAQHLEVLPGCHKLKILPEEFAKRFAHGWRMSVDFSSATHRLLLLVDANFPYSFPRICIEDGPELLSWPHLERHGLLCTMPSEASGDWAQPTKIVDFVLGQAARLIEHNLHSDVHADFQEEFLSYWSYACEAQSINGVSILEPVGPARQVHAYTGMSTWYFGETKRKLTDWLRHKNVLRKKDVETEKAWLIWLDSAWVPSDYPNSPADLLSLLRQHDRAIPTDLLSQSAIDGLVVVIGMPTPHGACFAGLRHSLPRAIQQGPNRQSGNPVLRGFRPDHVPPQLAIQRSLGASSQVRKFSIDRADHRWIHGRDQDTKEYRLKDLSVCIIGVGSLGSDVALLLAKSGVGELVLIDGDNLEWANISRHALGADFIGKNKAEGMKKHLFRTLPHIGVNAIGTCFTQSNSAGLDAALSSDLVLSLTGDWACTSWLNTAWLEADKPVSLIHAWMEGHALATHSVYLPQGMAVGCIACGFHSCGTPRLSVIDFPATPILKVPACGGSFVPYGAIALSKAAGFVAEHVVSVLLNPKKESEHAISICSNDQKNVENANWTNEWIASVGDPIEGEITVRRKWTVEPTCAQCAISDT